MIPCAVKHGLPRFVGNLPWNKDNSRCLWTLLAPELLSLIYVFVVQCYVTELLRTRSYWLWINLYVFLDNQKNTEKIRWVLDITIAYPNGQPLDLGTIIFGNRPPCKTTLFYRVYQCKDIPQDEEEQTKWLYKLFEEKERMLDVFYKTGKFPVTEFSHNPVQPHVVAQDCLRFLILHLFFITSTYVHMQMFLAAYEYYNYIMY